MSKLKRTLRNFRYRKSPGGQQTIRKVKDHYRNKDHAKELNKKDVLKYQSGSHGHDVLSEYLSSPGGKSSLKKAASRYQSSLAGKSSLKEAASRYQSSLAGKSSLKEAASRYESSLAGKSSRKEASSRYQSSLAGKSSLKKAASRYESSLAGKSSRKEASCRYESSFAGKSSRKEASSKYRSAPEFKEKRKDYEDSKKENFSQSRRTKYRRNRLFEEFEEEFEDDIDYCLTRKEAMKQIRKHTTRNGKKLRFLLHKERIKGFRKSVFLPNISYISRKGTFRTKSFMRSKSKLMWKNAVNRVMTENLNDFLANDIINEWYPSLNFKRNNQYKKKFIASQLQRRILNCRDLWIKILYGRCHKLNLTSEQLINEEKLDISEEKRFDSILGFKCHRKGVEPRFPVYSFISGKPFKFRYNKSSKKSREELRKSERCTKDCIPAGGSEVNRFKDYLARCRNLDVRNCRKFVQASNKCGNFKGNEMYSLKVGHRNHPESCLRSEAKNKCSSDLVLLRKLSVHYKNARTLYKAVNEMKTADQFVSDLDTATATGDIEYLLKLLQYEPPIAVKTFEVERPQEVINEQYMEETFPEQYLEFLTSINANHTVPCISCRRLTEDDPKKCKTITSRWKKVNIVNSEYMFLLRYLQSDEWLRMGGLYVDSLVGKRICNYCHSKMEKGEVPRISVRNGMNEGIVPIQIADLSQFECMFIRQISMFQTFLKLGPSVGNRPNNEKMSAVKGFSVHIPVPIQVNAKQLAGELPGLLNPKTFIVLHGLPNKDRKVWQTLINVDKVITALKWLVKNNPLYESIKVPTKGEILDMMCEADSDIEDGEGAIPTDSFDSFDRCGENGKKDEDISDTSPTLSSAESIIEPSTKRARHKNSNTSDDIGISLPEMLPTDNKEDPADLNDEFLERLCELDMSSNDDNLESNSSLFGLSSTSTRSAISSNNSSSMEISFDDVPFKSSDSEMSVDESKCRDKGGDGHIKPLKIVASVVLRTWNWASKMKIHLSRIYGSFLQQSVMKKWSE